LQQSISIIDTLLVRSDNSRFAIPLEEIENCQLISSSIISQKKNKQIPYVEELIPYISLREEFQYFSELPENQRLIVINKQEKRFAIIVDEIIGEYQAVVKSIGNTFSQVEFISGASLLGDGGIALLIDTEKLKKLIITNHKNTN
jgi:two-component system, chemotaxis family, sensor kinase CheA